MSEPTRRRFLFRSSGAIAGSFFANGLAGADEEGGYFSQSGLVTGKLKPLRHRAIPGFLSAEQMAPHHQAHYGGALRGYSAADKKLEQSVLTGTAIDAAAYGALQRSRTSKGNSVILHELYFDGMAPRGSDPGKALAAALKKRFGSVEKWADDFQNSALAAAGWAMLVRHPVNGKLYNVVSDEHAHGPLWMAVPLVVIDVYEHAFYIDYQNRKADYVKKFFNHINWQEAETRYRLAQR
ncbi:MAG: superoxide dismutase [Gemmatales bacterium]|nr:MAG: superoxide dismutase [Gemmatales bacterium]